MGPKEAHDVEVGYFFKVSMVSMVYLRVSI